MCVFHWKFYIYITNVKYAYIAKRWAWAGTTQIYFIRPWSCPLTVSYFIWNETVSLFALCLVCVDLKKKINETKNKQIYLEKKNHTTLHWIFLVAAHAIGAATTTTTTGKWAFMYQLLAEYDYDQAIKISVSHVFKFVLRSTTNEKKHEILAINAVFFAWFPSQLHRNRCVRVCLLVWLFVLNFLLHTQCFFRCCCCYLS